MSLKYSHFLHEDSFWNYKPTIKISLLHLKYQRSYCKFSVEKFVEKSLGSPLGAIKCPDEVRKLDKRGHLHDSKSIGQELAFPKSGYNSQSEQRFVSYGLLKLGYPKFLK